MTRQAWVTLPSCLASSSKPTFALITLRSVVVMAVSPVAPAGALRFAYGSAPRPLRPPSQAVRQIMSRLLQFTRAGGENRSEPARLAPCSAPSMTLRAGCAGAAGGIMDRTCARCPHRSWSGQGNGPHDRTGEWRYCAARRATSST